MPLIINSNGKVERQPIFIRTVRRFIRNLPDICVPDLSVATGDALDKLSDSYGVHRMNAISPDGEYCRCNEESDEALKNRLLSIFGR